MRIFLSSPARSQGPNQRAVLSELVTLVQTSSIGARKVRLRTRSLPRRRPVGSGFVLSSSSWIWFVTCLRWPARGVRAAAECGLEGIEATAPNARSAELREERVKRREGVGGERVLTLAAAHGVTHEARLEGRNEAAYPGWPRRHDEY